MLLAKSPNSYGKNCSAPRALQVEKYSALTKFCSAPGTRAIGFFTAWSIVVIFFCSALILSMLNDFLKHVQVFVEQSHFPHPYYTIKSCSALIPFLQMKS